MLSLFGIILGLALLIFLAFRGKSLLWAAPICALVVALTGGLDLFTAYTQDYMQGFVDFVLEWFPAFMLGAIFGQIMQDSGGAVALTKAVVKLVGRDKAIFASVLCGGLLALRRHLRLRDHLLHVSHRPGAFQGGKHYPPPDPRHYHDRCVHLLHERAARYAHHPEPDPL